MRSTRNFALAVAASALVLASGLALAGGCLAGQYQYLSDDGTVVGAESVGCTSSWSWGEQTGNRTFVAGCGSEF